MQQSNSYAIPGVRAQTYKPPGTKKAKKSKPLNFDMEDPAKRLSELLNLEGLTPAEKAMRITIWNRVERRKIAGNASPLRRNLAKYLYRNPQCDVFVGQDKFTQAGEIDQRTGSIVAGVARVAIWNPARRTKITGNAAPLPKNLAAYFARNPGMEVYRGQDLILEHIESDHDEQDDGEKQEAPLASHRNACAEGNVALGLVKAVDVKPEVHVFHETHEVVPDSFWVGNTLGKCERPNFRKQPNISECNAPAGAQATTQPSCPIPLDDGNPEAGTTENDWRDLDDITYEEMSSSWSNTRMWLDPNCELKLEPCEKLITPIYAETSLLYGCSPMDLSLEQNTDRETTGSGDTQIESSLDSREGKDRSDDVELNFEEYFVDDHTGDTS